MFRWYVRDLVGNVPEKGCYLAGGELVAVPCGGVKINCRRVIEQCVEAVCSSYDV